MLLKTYQFITARSAPLLRLLLKKRLKEGKENEKRLDERMGKPGVKRPAGHLLWFHAASVGEAQSVLILLDVCKKSYPDMQFLVTTGTVTSARLMEKRLPEWAIHQFYPLDHPHWAAAFLNYWNPDMAIWIESELWPNMLLEIKKRHLPLILINARMSERSFRRWSLIARSARSILSVFDLILAQSEKDAKSFRILGAAHVIKTDTLKYAASPLPVDRDEFRRFNAALDTRVGWLFASSHDGEEDLSFRVHTALKKNFPTLLTVVVPRDPGRADQIAAKAAALNLTLHRRSRNPSPPDPETDIYLVDTLGELGLFYSLCGIACIGRSFSRDGGGGHNPIEAAQLKCAILHGPDIQNFADVFEDMNQERAAILCPTEEELTHTLARLFFNPENIYYLQESAYSFVQKKSAVLHDIIKRLEPFFAQAGFNCSPPQARKISPIKKEERIAGG